MASSFVAPPVVPISLDRVVDASSSNCCRLDATRQASGRKPSKIRFQGRRSFDRSEPASLGSSSSSFAGERTFAPPAGPSQPVTFNGPAEAKLAQWKYTGPGFAGVARAASSFSDATYMVLSSEMLPALEDQIRAKIDACSAKCLVLTALIASSIDEKAVLAAAERVGKEKDVEILYIDGTAGGEEEAADDALARIVEHFINKYRAEGRLETELTPEPTANVLGMLPAGFHNLGDVVEVSRMLEGAGVEVNLVVSDLKSVEDIARLPRAWLNAVPYREIGPRLAALLEREFGTPRTEHTPMGVLECRLFLLSVQEILNTKYGRSEDFNEFIKEQSIFGSDAAWFARSIDCQNLMTKRAFVFGDATHAAAMTRILWNEMDIKVAVAGTYSTAQAEWFREQVKDICETVLVTEDSAEVLAAICGAEDIDAIFGTQVERWMSKQLKMSDGTISAPLHCGHIRHSLRPFAGYEGTNVIADLIYNSFTLGMEDHLLDMFGGHDTKEAITPELSPEKGLSWTSDGMKELNSIPGFVRGRVKRNVEKYARQKGIEEITAEVMYAAKESVGA
eukprot:tig00021234_g19404.t1